ncbi:hypothetical protein I316_02699 [Kwoniella heveanensis BCC8398]|uniref:Uncharacterized protein n=1 Tax=Kwoniella heveanensis BCC8398 TaxID=1296120 RepID=A0A1B9GX85_9TREE|nr:hypothetical protein I316_02699 [Kwoniella heveanensis BCC8398]
MKYTLLVLAVAGLANAQSNSTNTLIPSNITSSCSTFLTSLNNDGTLSSCVTPLINATASFSPTSGANLTDDSINYTLASLCKKSSGCSDSTIRGWLADFYSQCYTELTSTTEYNEDVRELYDILYVVNPLKAAVCSVNSANQDYCVNEIVASEAAASGTASNSTAAANSTASANATESATNATGNALFASFASTDSILTPVQIAAQNLYIEVSTGASSLTKRFVDTVLSRQEAQSVNMATIITPNATTYRSTNLPFLFLQPEMTSSALCTPCTREVLVAYVKWETQVPYALGLKQSPILGGQSALWSAINGTCGQSFVNAIMSQVGAYASNSSSGADRTVFLGLGGSGIAGLIVAVGASFVASLATLL